MDFTLLLSVLNTNFDQVDTGEGYTKLQNFRPCNGTQFSDFSNWIRVLVSTVTGEGSCCVSGDGSGVGGGSDIGE